MNRFFLILLAAMAVHPPEFASGSWLYVFRVVVAGVALSCLDARYVRDGDKVRFRVTSIKRVE